METQVIKKRSLFKIDYTSKVNIKADASRIWHLLTDIDNFTKWNSTFSSIKGDMRVKGKLEITSPEVPGKIIKTEVKELIPKKWILLGKGSLLTFKVRRSYFLTELEDGSTDFEMGESFTGLLVPTFGEKIPDLTPMFESFMDDLRKAV